MEWRLKQPARYYNGRIMANTSRNFVIAVGILLNTAFIADITARSFIIQGEMALTTAGAGHITAVVLPIPPP